MIFLKSEYEDGFIVYEDFIDQLRRKYDKIKKMYNSLAYEVKDMFVDHRGGSFRVVVDKPENFLSFYWCFETSCPSK